MFKSAKANHIIKSFARDARGTFAPTFALATMAIMLSAGAAIDYSQLARAKSIMNASLDAAVLAAGNEYLQKAPNDAALRKVFEDFFYANLSSNAELLAGATIDKFEFNRETGKVKAEVGTPVQMAFMGLLGKTELPVVARTEAAFSTTPVEVSMVLDVTGSMNWSGKLDSLKLAAKDAVDILLPDGQPNHQVRLGLVPYSEGVRLKKSMAKKASGQNKRLCMTERTYNPATDVSYNKEYVSAIAGANCSSSKIRPLTGDAKALKKDIKNLTASGYTAGQLGISWGYYMLSENWKGLWPKNSKPADYGGDTKKIVILMTDGSFNTHFKGFEAAPRGNDNDPYDPRVVASNDSAIALCDDMKDTDRNIKIYSVAFNAPPAAKATLENCANENTPQATYYYDATSEEELRTAFREIANSIKTLRLTR